jgi:hypothetical protein
MTSMKLSSAVDVGQERHLTSTLDRHRDLVLVTSAGPGDAAWTDLALLGHGATKGRQILGLDLFELLAAIGAEAASVSDSPTDHALRFSARLLSWTRHGRFLLAALGEAPSLTI